MLHNEDVRSASVIFGMTTTIISQVSYRPFAVVAVEIPPFCRALSYYLE
jgi:hypothetical protein